MINWSENVFIPVQMDMNACGRYKFFLAVKIIPRIFCILLLSVVVVFCKFYCD